MFIKERIVVSQEERKAIDIFASLLEMAYNNSNDDDILDIVSILRENLETFNDFTDDEY